MRRLSNHQLSIDNELSRSLFTVVAVAFLIFMPVSLGAQQSGDAKLKRAIEKANSEFIEAVKTGNASVIAAPYTENAVFVAFDGTCIRGRSEIEKMYRARFQRSGPAKSAKIDSKNLIVDGEFAYESGDGEIGSLIDGKLTINGGRFLTVWQRQPDGEWKITRNIVLP